MSIVTCRELNLYLKPEIINDKIDFYLLKLELSNYSFIPHYNNELLIDELKHYYNYLAEYKSNKGFLMFNISELKLKEYATKYKIPYFIFAELNTEFKIKKIKYDY